MKSVEKMQTEGQKMSECSKWEVWNRNEGAWVTDNVSARRERTIRESVEDENRQQNQANRVGEADDCNEGGCVKNDEEEEERGQRK